MNKNRDSDGSGIGYGMKYGKVKLPKPQDIPGTHPFKSQENHDKLLSYIQDRLAVGRDQRDGEKQRFINADQAMSGWMKLDADDRERVRKQAKDGSPAAVKMNLPLTFVHIDDMMTYFAQTFAPTRGMFYHTAKPDEVDPSTQIVTVMNNHAMYAGYYREMLLGILSMLKYNCGGFHVSWSKDFGPKIEKDSDGADRLTSELRWQGNKLEALDRYNFFCDPSVPPHKLYCEGEFAARATMVSHYWLQKRAADGVYFNCDELLEAGPQGYAPTYYISPPQEAQMNMSNGSPSSTAYNNQTDWVSILGDGIGQGKMEGYEKVEIYIKLIPTDFGLVPAAQKATRQRYEMWRFTLINDEKIIEATYMNNIHGFLPFFLGVLNDDVMGPAQKSTLEILAPLQNFASFLLNTHVLANRKNLWGTTYYDPSMIDMKSIPEGEVAARVPMKPSAQGRDIRTGVYHNNNVLDTKQTLGDLSAVMGIIDQFFPTQSLPSQIAGIDRAVNSQVAAVQQGVNRRQQKSARLIDDLAMRPIRFCMYYNIIQYQPDEEEVMDYYTGKPQKVDLNALRQTDLPFIIGMGLKSVDRQAAAEQLQKIIFALIQAPAAAQGIKLLELINYWTSMMDIDVDMTQFEKPPEQVAAEQGAAAGTDAAGNPIQPATNPGAVTDPIYG